MGLNWFAFNKKDDLIERYSLRQIPLFSSLADSDLSNISKKVRLIEFRKGDTIYREGDTVNAFYIIISGRCRVFVHQLNKADRTLAYLHKGDYFGEVSLLTEKTHAANIEAINDSIVLEIAKNDFFELIHSIPAVSFQISRRLGLRIKKLYESESFISDTKIISLLQLSTKEQNAVFGFNFAASLKNETNTELLFIDMSFFLKNESMRLDNSIVPFPINASEEFSFAAVSSSIVKHSSGFDMLNLSADIVGYYDLKILTAFLTDLLTTYKYVIINVIPSYNNEIVPFLEQSDLVYVIADSDARSLQRCNRVISKVYSQYNLSPAELRLVLYEPVDSKRISIEYKESVAGWKIFSLLPYFVRQKHSANGIPMPVVELPHDPFSRTIRFLARELAGILIGLALGSGAAFGLAHIGVLKALEKENIRVDIVSGCSIGSIIGALWAAGYSADEIEQIALSFKKKRDLLKLIDFFDLCLPFSGFCKGRTVKRFLKKYLNKKQFKHMHIPLCIVATDLLTSEDVVFKEGSVIDAVRASISIPGVVKPMKHNGRLLIDGGVTNPLPISLLIDEGVRKTIAVNVLPSPKDILESQECVRIRQDMKASELQKNNFLQKAFLRLKIYQRNVCAGNIVNVLMNTIQYLEATVSSKQYSDADIVIHPSVCDSQWYQFYEPEKFIRCGEMRAMEVIGDIKRLIGQQSSEI
jgi:NTE family protein